MRRLLLVVIALGLSRPPLAHADAGSDAGTCAVDGDCEAGLKCDTAHSKCVTPDPDPDNTNSTGCGCRHGGSTTAPFLLGLAMLGLLRRR